MNAPNPYAPPQGDVRDIETAGVGLELAARGTRLLASFIDSLIIAAMVYAPFLIGLLGVGGIPQPGEVPFLGLLVGFALGCLGFVVWAVLTVRSVLRNGQSLAKRMLGIKVVRSDGAPVSFARILWLRNVLNMVLSMIPLYSLIDAVLIFGEERQCLHDKIADTIVVKA
jgi:uncharacterized RDD family membrane protein YckC